VHNGYNFFLNNCGNLDGKTCFKENHMITTALLINTLKSILCKIDKESKVDVDDGI